MVGAAVAVVLGAGGLTGCTVTAGAASLIDGSTISESAVQNDTAAFMAQNPTAPATDADVVRYNGAQITYQVRHALFAKAVAAQHIVITNAQINSATAEVRSQTQGANVAAQLSLPDSDEAGVIQDLVTLDALVKVMPANGVSVDDVTVTAEGVIAATRNEAVILRSKYLADPDSLDRAVKAAGANGVAKTVFSLIKQPGVGADGLFRASPGGVAIVPDSGRYIVLRTTGRAVKATSLTATAITSATALSDVFDLGALLVSKYQDGAGISVNPRFGVWDPASVQVVPGNDGL